MKLQTLKNFLLDTLFPQFCLNCGREGALVCQDCLSTISLAEYLYCPFCSEPTRVFIKQSGKCLKHRAMALDGLFAAASYQQTLVKKLIKQFKYQPYLKSLGRPLSYLIIAHFATTENQSFLKTGENPTNQNANHSPALFIPVPLLKSKKRKRGFNQAEVLCKELSSFLQIPAASNALLKVKKTRSQTGLKKEERLSNVQGAFAVVSPQKILGKKILLVDDVFTTGSTMEECAKVLKQAGASAVWGIAVAREALA